MNLGLFLAIGESFKDLEEKGQLKRLTEYNIEKYSEAFDKVFIFTYKDEKGYRLPKNCYLVPNNKNINRFVYSIVLPLIKRTEIDQCNILRGLQITGGIPASVAKIVFKKTFIINYDYVYSIFFNH